MDYQSNNQSGGPQNTGEPYHNINHNTDNSTNPYSNTPVNNGAPYNNGSADSNSPYGDNSYPNQGTHNGSMPYGNAPGSGNPYDGTNPYNNTASGQAPYSNTAGTQTPYDNAPGTQAPYGSAAGNGNLYGNTPVNNGNPYGNNPYHNANQYNNPYNNGNPYHGPYNNRYPYGNVHANIIAPLKTKGDSMATAAMILGIISLVSLVLLRVYIPFLVGGVGIILAILSKGNAKKMIGKARAGLICCITGLMLDIVLCISSVYLVFALPDIMPDMVDEVNEICEEQYGMTYDEFMDEIYEMLDMER